MSTPDILLETPAPVGAALPRRSIRGLLTANPSVALGATLIMLMVAVAAIGPLVWSLDGNAESFPRLAAPTSAHPMGTDDLGRDTLARVIHGSQVSLEVGVIAASIGLILGLVLGVGAGLFGRLVDAVVMRVVDVMFAFPALVFAMLMSAVLGPSELTAAVTIGVVFSPAFARVARGATLEVLARPFIEAAHCLGGSRWWILRREVFPNITGPLIAVTTIYISAAILLESGLSFLGLGVQPPTASLGNMLNEAQTYIQLAWWMAVFPGLGIALAVLGFNFLGDGLRDILDPRRGEGDEKVRL